MFWIVLLIAGGYIVSDIFVFRFDKNSTFLSEAITKKNQRWVQKLMTPPWVKKLSKINYGFIILLIVYLVSIQAWVWLGIIILYWLGVSLFVVRFSPWPSYARCTDVILAYLQKQLNNKVKEGVDIRAYPEIMAIMLDIKKVCEVSGIKVTHFVKQKKIISGRL